MQQHLGVGLSFGMGVKDIYPPRHGGQCDGELRSKFKNPPNLKSPHRNAVCQYVALARTRGPPWDQAGPTIMLPSPCKRE